MNWSNETIVDVRFNEVDTLRIVWHGHYVNYFEQGRESLGNANGIGYQYMIDHDVAVPIVKLACEYKRPLKYGDKARIVTTYLFTEAAKLVYTYKIYNNETNELVATGRTEQVFTDPASGELYFTYPEFMNDWVERCKKNL